MNIQNSRSTAARMSRGLLGGMALMVAAAMTLWSPNAAAQGKANFSNGQTCNFTTFSYNATSQTLDIQCTTTTTTPPPPPPPPTGPAVFTWSGGTTTSNTASSIVLTRAGGNLDQSYTISYNIIGNFGGWTLPSLNNTNEGTITFAANDSSQKSIPFNPGAGTGRMWVSTTALSGSPEATSPGLYAFDVTSGVAAAPPPPPGCGTSAHYNETFSFSGQKHVFNLKPGETASVAFTPRAGTTPQLATTETVNTPANADHEVMISDCPGKFDQIAPCAFQANYVGLSMNVATSPPSGWAAYYQCHVPAGQTRYMNIRQVVKGSSPLANSCTQGACEVRLQIQGF